MPFQSLTTRAALLAACCLAPSACTTTTPATPERTTRDVPRYTIEQFLDVTSLTGAAVSPDGSKVLFSSDASGIYNAYEVPVAGGTPRALTDSTDQSIYVRSYFPADERFVYMADEGGDELDHVYVRELDGSVTDVTPGENLKASFAGWAQDDRSFFLLTNERDERYFDLYEVGLTDGYPRERLYEDDDGFAFADISPDRRYLAFNKLNTTSDSDVYLVDRRSGEKKHLTPHEGVASFSAMGFSPDGTALWMTTDEGSEFSRLVSYDLDTGETETILEPDWDVSYAYHSKEGTYLVVGINADARTDLRVYEAATMKPVTLPELPDAEITSVGISRDERLMTFYASSSRRPPNLYVVGLGEGRLREPRRLTDASSPELDPDELVDGHVVRFDSYDGVEIPGILYRPRQAGPGTEAPAVIYIHGGPGGQTRIGYNPLIQYLVNHGYGVYAINNRGSSGYGKTFFRLDDQKHGEADLDDVVAAKGMLIGTGWVDPERIGVLGGSYGGYLTLAAMTFRPEEFQAGVDLFGISNWVRTLESIPPWWEAIREALYVEMGDPETSRERFHRISPLFHADRIVNPLMVLQGANDPRVLQAESDSIVEAVRANGVPVEYVLFEDEGHGFVKKENREEGFRKIREFLDKYLKGAAPEEMGEKPAR
jgi:dipeptidyl aminopeptidase/acylaminoacyl peptidase